MVWLLAGTADNKFFYCGGTPGDGKLNPAGWELGTPVTRIFLIFGSAVSLLILTVWSGPAEACVIATKDVTMVSANSDECTGPTEEKDGIRDPDRQEPSEEHLAPSYPPGFVLWLSTGGRLEVLVKRNPGVFVNVDDTESDEADGSGPRNLPQPQILATGPDHHVALRGRSAYEGTDPSYNVLRQAAKYYLAPYYDAITRNGDVAAMLRVGAEAIHYLDDVVGPEPVNRYQSISLDGNAADTGLPAAASPRTSVDGSFQRSDRMTNYIMALRSFLFSRDGLISALIVMTVYIAIAGFRSLTRIR